MDSAKLLTKLTYFVVEVCRPRNSSSKASNKCFSWAASSWRKLV